MTETNNSSPDRKSYLGIDADGFDRLSGKKNF